MQIYQLFVGRQEKANSRDNPGAVFDLMLTFEWGRLKAAGFETVYLLGVFDATGPILVGEEDGVPLDGGANREPSMFAITDHMKPNPVLGTPQQLSHLIDTIHRAGLLVWLDFVPNQTSTVHPWIKTHPEYYKRDENNFVSAFSGDVYLLDLQRSEVVEAMKQIVGTMAAWGADGARCDMAHLAPISFWRAMTGAVKQQNPQFTFAAEAYADSVFDWQPLHNLLDAGFDYCYHEFLYRNFKQAGAHDLAGVVGHLKYVQTLPYAEKLVHYVSNHDDPVPIGLTEAVEAAVILMCVLGGSTLIYNGSLCGLTKRLKHHSFEFLPALQSEFETAPRWYSNVQVLLKTFGTEEITYSQTGERVIEALMKTASGQSLRWLFNFSGEELPVPVELTSEGLLHNTAEGAGIESGQAEVWIT